MKKRILSLLLALVMITTLLPLGLYDTAWAAEISETAEATEIASGNCGAGGVEDSSVRWVLTDDGTMTISGTGAMCDEEMPWWDFSSQINRVVIESGVTTVGAATFPGCENLTEAVLPDTLTTISKWAFDGSSLTKITIPDGVTTIGDGAFRWNHLVDVVIPDSVTTIGKEAFMLCEEMQTLHLGSGLTSIGAGAFNRVRARVTISADNRSFTVQNNVLLSADKAKLIQCFDNEITRYDIPTGVQEIGVSAFDCCSALQNVTIPDTVQFIGSRAFGQCRGLERLDIPASVTYITPNAFFCVTCPITVAEGNTSYLNENSVIYSTGKELLLYAGAVEGAFQIPAGVKEIGAAAFSGAKLSDVTIPGSVTDIGHEAFFDCRQLQSVTLPGSVQSMGNQLFGYCSNLVEATIGDGIGVIPTMMFDNCTALTSVRIPKTVTEVEESAFTGCDALETVHYAGSAEDWGSVTVAGGNEALDNANFYFNGETGGLLPGKVTLTGAVVGENGITVSWRRAANAARYNVYRKAAGETDWTIIATVEDNSYTDADVEMGELYTYTVRGIASDGETLSPSTTDVTVLMTDRPSGGCGVNGSDDYSVRWVLGEDGTLTISGTSAMCDEEMPWWEFRSQINRVVIESGVTTVGSNAFNNFYNLTAVELPGTLTAIGDYAFAWSNIAEITIPDGVVTIGAGAFWGTALVDVVIPDSVTTIGDSAFRYCWEMKTLHLGSSLTTVEGYAFDRCEAAVTLSADNRALVLEDNALLNAEKTRLIQYFEGPADTGRAEAYTIPTGVEEICDGAFDCCDDLKTIVIPDTVQRIGQEAFGQCSNLEGLTIPASVTKIESSAFLYNKYPVHVAAANTAYCSEDGVVYSKNKDTLCYAGAAAGAYSIPNGVAFIGDTAASGAAITSLTLPASVEKIGDEAFQDCGQLQTLTFLGSIKEIGHSTFSGCHSLNRVTIPEGLKKIPASAFSSCTDLRSVTIPKSVTMIERSAFEACDSLLDVYYAGSKTDWEQILIVGGDNNSLWNAAIHYDGSTTVLVPDVVVLGEAEANADGVVVTWEKATNAVWYKVYRKDAVNTRWTVIATVRNTSYTDSDVEAGVKYTYTVRGVASDGKTLSPSYDTTGVSVKVGTEPENLGRGNCGAGGVNDSSVRWILTSDGTMTISGTGAMAMWEAEEYPWLELRDQIRSVVIRTGVTTVGSYAFSDCNNLETVEFPNTLMTIGEGAFMNSHLRDVVIPDSVRTIESNAFAGCGLMYKLSLGSGLTTIGDFAFEWCSPSVRISEDNRAFVMEDGALFNAGKTKLIRFFSDWVTSYTIPTGVKEIGAGAFEGSLNLKTITIPDGVQSIRTRAFAQLWKLERLTIPASVTEIAVDAFLFIVCPITVAADNTAYCSQNDALYSKNKDTLLYAAGATGAFIIPNTVVTIEENAFAESTISSVTIPNSVKTIGNWAFSGCVNLRTVTLPASVTEIGEGVFGGCTNLTSVRIPASVKTIQKWAFEGCEALTDVYYDGSEADWKKIVIYEDGNEPLLKAKLHTSEVVAPANVTLTGAKAVSGGIRVTWQAAANAATYTVYRMGPGDTHWKVVSAKQSGTSYTDKNVTAGNTYKYTVRGVASDGKTLSPSFNNTGVSATMPKPVTAPANVTLTGAKAVSGGIQVTWQAAANAATYNVYRIGPGDTNWKIVSAKQSGTSYTDKNVTAGNTYKYTVRGVASDGKTLSPGFNNTGVSATMPKPVTTPANVTLGSAKAVTGGIQVTWQAAAGAATYNVYRMGPGDTNWKVVSVKQSGTSYTDKNVTAGSTYKYTVRGVAADGKTLSPGFNNTGVSATVPKAAAVPAEVKMGDATARGSYITVDWSRAANASAYRVYRRINNSTDWRMVASSVNGTSYTDWNVEPGVRYSYTVRGIAADGKTLSRTYDRVGVFAFARISADNLANDSVLKIFPIEDVPYNLTRMNWDYLLYFYKGDTIEQLPSEFGGQLRLLFNNDGTAYLVTGNGVGRGMYNADKLVISIVFPGSDIPLVYVATFTQLDGKTYLFLMPDISGRDALVFGALSYR